MEHNKEEKLLFSIYYLSTIDYSKMFVNCSRCEFIIMTIIDNYLNKNNADKIYITTLADELSISVPAVSRTLRNLEFRRLIKRNIDVFCRRNTYVKFTEKGKKVFAENKKKVIKIQEKLTKLVDEKELSSFINTVDVIRNFLDEELGGNKNA